MKHAPSSLHALVLVIAGVAAGAACGGPADRAGAPAGEPTTTPGADPLPDADAAPSAAVPDWDDATAIAWLDKKCGSCHFGAGQVEILWPNGEASKKAFETSELTPLAYQTIRHRLIERTDLAPPPMPPAPAAADPIELRAMLAWFEKALPLSVVEADDLYGNDTSSKPKVALDFKCSTPSTLRQFAGRLYLGALDRPASAAELGGYTAAELNAPVTSAQRLALVGLLETTLKAEFLDSGLRKLAAAIGGGPSVSAPPDGISAAAAADLDEELYRMMRAKYDTLDYVQYFSEGSVMVSANTAPLYAGCATPAAGTWAPCALALPRKGYFTTVGFLTARPSSFMVRNNNYGRVRRVGFTAYGAFPAAADSGPMGDATPLPSCLESADTRTLLDAPRGSAAVSSAGALCQTCHLRRHLAAGSIALRPFASNGSIFDPSTLGAPGSADLDRFTEQTQTTQANQWEYTSGGATKPVDAPFLASLLASSLASSGICVLKGTGPYVPATSIADIAAMFTGNKTGLSRGFMRHAQRAFAASRAITLEMVYRATVVNDGAARRLPDLVRAFFMSDTLACEVDL